MGAFLLCFFVWPTFFGGADGMALPRPRLYDTRLQLQGTESTGRRRAQLCRRHAQIHPSHATQCHPNIVTNTGPPRPLSISLTINLAARPMTSAIACSTGCPVITLLSGSMLAPPPRYLCLVDNLTHRLRRQPADRVHHCASPVLHCKRVKGWSVINLRSSVDIQNNGPRWGLGAKLTWVVGK